MPAVALHLTRSASAPRPILPALQGALRGLLNFGHDLIGRMVGARTYATYTHVPRRFRRDPVRAEQRINRALDWVYALTRTLAGDDFYLRRYTPVRPRKANPATPRAALQPTRPRRPATPAQREIAQLRAIRIAFETIPVARIAHRLARRLGVHEKSDSWPRVLLLIADTPAECCARANRPAPQTWPEPPAPTDLPEPPQPPADPPVPLANPPARAGP